MCALPVGNESRPDRLIAHRPVEYRRRVGDVVRMPPRGRYLAHEAGRLAGVSGNTIGQWARRGYIRSSQSAPGRLPKVYSFQDVAEAMVVHELVDRGVPHRDIRATIEALRAEGGDWPLTQLRDGLATADVSDDPSRRRAMLVVGSGAHVYDVARAPAQQVIRLENLRRIVADLSRGGWAVRDEPDLNLIQVDPEVIGGRPSIRGRRIPAELVAELATTAEGIEVLSDDYDLSIAEIRDARRWWERVRQYERAA